MKISIYRNTGHPWLKTGMSDTVSKEDYLRTLLAKFV